MKLAQRMNKLGTENAFIILAEVNKLISKGKDIISFCIGEPDFDTPDNIKKAAPLLEQKGFSIDIDYLNKIVNNRTKMIIIPLIIQLEACFQ